MSIRKKALVLGEGEIGMPIFKLLLQAYGPNAVKSQDIKPKWDEPFDWLHICYPEEENFMKTVSDYYEKYEPRGIIIHSTLSPGMTRKVDTYLNYPEAKVAMFYSPVRGNKRDDFTWGLKTYTKYVAVAPYTRVYGGDATEFCKQHLEDAGFKVKMVYSTRELEYAKIFNLSYYAVCIAFFQELERICERVEMQEETIKEFIGSTEFEAADGGKRVPRPLYYGGYIGGHCVMQAVEKVLAKHDAPLFRAVVDSNMKRHRELRNLP